MASMTLVVAQLGGAYSMLTPLALIMLLMYFLLIKPEQKKQREQADMFAALKKDDRVLTTSGMYGVVTNVHREANKVTLKVDESSNVKLQVTLPSIARILSEDPKNLPAQ